MEFWWCFEAPGRFKPGRRGSHTTARELQTCTFEGSDASKHHQIYTRRPPERHNENETVAGERRKSAKFWASHPSGPPPFGASPFGAGVAKVGQLRLAKVGLAKVGQLRLAKVGQIFLAKVGLAKVGQLRLAKVGQIFLAKVGLAKVGIGQSRPIVMAKDRIGQSRSQPTRSSRDLDVGEFNGGAVGHRHHTRVTIAR